MVIFWGWPLVRRLKAGGNLKELFIKIACAGLIYGTGMEFIQKFFIRGRSFDVGDIVADAAGCLLGALFGLGRYIKK
jgi:VanZ family protein